MISGWGWDLMRPFRSLDNLYAVTRECLDASNCPRLKDMNPKNNLLCVGDTEIPLNSECKGDSGGTLHHDFKYYITNVLYIYMAKSYYRK